MFEQLWIKHDQRQKMFDSTATKFYRCQDTRPTGIDNECKYFVQKLEHNVTLIEKIYKRFSTNASLPHRYLN